jgi:uncharacterized protein (DUF362 family)
MKIDRRAFIQSATAATAAGMLSPGEALAAAGEKPVIYVAHGDDPEKMLLMGIEKLGGFGRLVKKGAKVTLKPNAAWASRPEQGGNTDPRLVGACVKACRAAGAARVVVPENPCSPEDKAFGQSGVEAAVKAAGGEMYAPSERAHFREVKLPKGKALKETDVVVDVLDTDLLINMPVAKSHGSCTITASLKNWMGAVKNRKIWHLKGVHQCIADVNTAIKADLIVVDATRIMTTDGPRGPGKVERPRQIIIGRDPVAVDAYVATLFKLKPFAVEHIKIAHDMGLGVGDLGRVEVVKLNVQ